MIFFVDWFFIIGMLVFAIAGIKMAADAVMPAIVFIAVIIGIVLLIKLGRKLSDFISEDDNFYNEPENHGDYWNN